LDLSRSDARSRDKKLTPAAAQREGQEGGQGTLVEARTGG
jgi:hypothetical protein